MIQTDASLAFVLLVMRVVRVNNQMPYTHTMVEH